MTKQAVAPASIRSPSCAPTSFAHSTSSTSTARAVGSAATSRRASRNRDLPVPRLGLAFDEVGPDDLLHVSFALERLAGGGKVNPTLTFHSEIYRARPDVGCVVHTHADHLVAPTATGTRFELVTQLAAILHDDWCLPRRIRRARARLVRGRDARARARAAARADPEEPRLIAVRAAIGEAVIGAVVMEAVRGCSSTRCAAAP